MRALACALVLACSTAALAGGGASIAVLTGDARREAVLVDALRIYTRDLGRRVRVAGPPPTTLDAAAIARVADEARAGGDEIVVWLATGDGAPVLLALRVATLELRETAVERDAPLRSARTLALKVRALLTTAQPRDWSVPPEARAVEQQVAPPDAAAAAPPSSTAPPTTAPPSSTAPPTTGLPSSTAPRTTAAPAAAPSTTAPPATTSSTTAPSATSPSAAPSATTSSTTAPSATSPSAAPIVAAAPPAPAPSATPSPPAVAEPARRERRERIAIAAEYAVVVPTEPIWLRQGLLVRISAPLPRVPLVLFADAAFTTAPSTTLDDSRVAARIWPVGAGLAVELRRPRWLLVGGPRASLQIIDVDVHAADGRVAATRLYSAGLGLAAVVRFRATRQLGLVGSVFAEALVPRVQLTAGGPSATDLGWVQLGFSAGAVFSAP